MGWLRGKRKTENQEENAVPNLVGMTEDSLLDQAQAFLSAGNTQSALAALDRAITRNPGDPTPYIRRADARRKIKDEIGAAKDMSMAKLMIGRMDEGLKANDDGNAAYTAGEYGSAVQHFNKSLSLLPTLTSTYYWRGLSKRYMDDFAGAIEDFALCIAARASNTADAHYARGQIKYHKMNDPAAALEDYNRAIELKPDDPDFYRSRAILLDDHAAIRDLTKAIELDQSNPNTYVHRSLKRMSFQDYDGAIRDLTVVIGMAPDNLEHLTVSEVFSMRSSARMLSYDFPAALGDADKAVELDPRRASAFLDRGTIKSVMKDAEAAISDFDTAIRLDTSLAEAYYQRGLAKQQLGLQVEGDTDIAMAKELGFVSE
jgi:tetratricopeptide (TPR) repeat protein